MAKQKLLVVDDEKDFVEVLAERLEAKGFKIIQAFNGKEGLEKAYAEKPDMIILDVMMPEMNGYDLCRKLKLDETLKDIPIIMLTAKFQPNDVEFGKEMGADAYMTKPLELDLLLHKVNVLFRARRKKEKRGWLMKLKKIVGGFIIAMALLSLSNGAVCAENQSSNGSEISAKLDEILKNQNAISEQIASMKEELRIIKVRITQGQ